MNNNQKRWMVLLILVLIIVIIVAVVISLTRKEEKVMQSSENQVVNQEKYTTQLEDGTKLNTSDELSVTKTYGDLEFSNIQFTERDGVSVLLADITNKGTETHKTEIVKITIIGEDGEKITELKPLIGEIKPGETDKLNAVATADIANAKDFTIEAAE